MIIATYLLAGAFAGLIAGLLGVGGGIIIVPVLVLSFEAQGFHIDVLTHMAIATSLACIVFTSISSTISHNSRQSVDWRILKRMVPGIIVGGILGVSTAVQLSGHLLRQLVGVFAVLIAIKMVLPSTSVPSVTGRLPKRVFVPAGLFIGWVSALFGIGGGTVSVPFFNALGMSMQRVVGTAAACGFPIALVGMITNIYAGLDNTDLPENSLGFVYLPAVLTLSIASVILARVGAKRAHEIPAQTLRRLFSICLFIVGAKFLFF
jgi:uncharacterized membrane protein YfcA